MGGAGASACVRVCVCVQQCLPCVQQRTIGEGGSTCSSVLPITSIRKKYTSWHLRLTHVAPHFFIPRRGRLEKGSSIEGVYLVVVYRGGRGVVGC